MVGARTPRGATFDSLLRPADGPRLEVHAQHGHAHYQGSLSLDMLLPQSFGAIILRPSIWSTYPGCKDRSARAGRSRYKGLEIHTRTSVGKG